MYQVTTVTTKLGSITSIVPNKEELRKLVAMYNKNDIDYKIVQISPQKIPTTICG